jgi:hypothetical protein
MRKTPGASCGDGLGERQYLPGHLREDAKTDFRIIA